MQISHAPSSKDLIPKAAWLLPLVPLLLWALLADTFGDTAMFYGLNSAAALLPTGAWGLAVFLGNGWGVFCLAIPMVFFAPKALTACIIGGSLAGLVSRTLKFTLEFPRPAAVLDNSTFHIIGEAIHHYAMPSGHTLTVFAVATGLYFSMARQQRLWGVWLFAVAVFGGLGRIAIGAHWPSDVFAGAAIGILGGLVGIVIAHRLPASWFKPNSGWLRFVTYAGGGVGLFVLCTERLDLEQNQPLQALGVVIIIATMAHFTRRYILTKGQLH
jgi:membrane-associated phospholipid phosphatase